MTPSHDGETAPRSNRPSRWRPLAYPVLAALFAFGAALALPPEVSAPVAVARTEACSGYALALPPGHPPVDARALPFRAHGFRLPPGIDLPPGHPPIDGPGLVDDRPLPRRAAPMVPQPHFDHPEIVDI